LQGVVGQFFAALAATLTVAVLVSLLLALSLIPLLAEQFVTAHEVAASAPRWRPLARLERALDALAPRYERALAAVLHHPRRVARRARGGAVVCRGDGFPPGDRRGGVHPRLLDAGGYGPRRDESPARRRREPARGYARDHRHLAPHWRRARHVRHGAELGRHRGAARAPGPPLTRHFRGDRRRPQPDPGGGAAAAHRVHA